MVFTFLRVIIRLIINHQHLLFTVLDFVFLPVVLFVVMGLSWLAEQVREKLYKL